MKKLRRWFTGLLAAVILAAAPTAAKEVSAASAESRYTVNPGIATLQTNCTYNYYDVTGDGKTDSLALEAASYDSFNTGKQGYLKIYINGENVFTLNDPYYKGDATWKYDVKLCTLNNSEVFFFIRTCSETGYYNFCRLYRYDNGSMKSVLNLKNTYKNVFHHRERMDVANVTGNRIQMQWYGQLGAVGALNWMVEYRWDSGKFYRTGRTCPVLPDEKERSFTASKSFRAYTTAALKQKAFTVHKGDILKVTQVYNNSKYAFVRLMNEKGKAGWIPCPNTHSPYFKEAMYVG